MQALNVEPDRRAYGPLVDECKKRGISKSVAYELINDDLLETFTIGRKRYVMLDSLDSLPQRLAEREATA